MASHLLFLDFSGGEFLLIALVFLMFFGSKSIPGVARTLGKAVREFKDAAGNVQREIQESSGMNEIKESLNNMTSTESQAPKQVTPPAPNTVLVKEEPKKDEAGQAEKTA